ncbi:unnamed protein product, partial [marine sediment metagenome]
LLAEIYSDDYDIFFGLSTYGLADQLVLFSHGIFIGIFSIAGLGFEYCVCVNLKKRLVDIQISRENVIKNEKWNTFVYSLLNSILNRFEENLSDTEKFIHFLSRIIEERYHLLIDKGPHPLDIYPFLKIIADRAPFPVITEGKLSYINLEKALEIDQLTIYTCCSNNYSEEIEFICKLSNMKNIFFVPYEMPTLYTNENDENYFDLVKWTFAKDHKDCIWLDLRKVLIESCTPVEKTRSELLPSNVRLVKFPEYIKPLVVIKTYAIVQEEEKRSLGRAYWANILLWK